MWYITNTLIKQAWRGYVVNSHKLESKPATEEVQFYEMIFATAKGELM